MSAFDEATAVEPAGAPGLYLANVGTEWNAAVLPFGGFMTALAGRAMATELGDAEQRLRSITTVYAGQVAAGDVEVAVTTLRRGRSVSQLMATVRNPGADSGHTSIAVFGGKRWGFEFTDLELPDVPPPEECPSFRDPAPEGWNRPRFPFWELQVEGRPAHGHAPWEDWEPTTSERVMWYRYEQPPRLPDGTLDPLALVTLCDTMPGAVNEKVGPMGDMWFAPSADLTVHLLGDARSDWLLARNRARWAGDGYASAELELWDPEARSVVAYGTQVMIFSTLG